MKNKCLRHNDGSNVRILTYVKNNEGKIILMALNRVFFYDPNSIRSIGNDFVN